MSTADFLIGQMTGENEVDPVLFNPDQHSLPRPSQAGLDDHDTIHAMPYPLAGLAGEHHKSHQLPFPHQLGGLEEQLYPFNNDYLFHLTDLTSVTGPSSSSPNISSSLTTPPSAISQEDGYDEAEKPSPKRKKDTAAKAKSSRQKPSTERPPKPAPKTRTQPRREASKVDDHPTEAPREKKVKHRRQRSLERNRVAASKCRKRKKEWTEDLEQKKTGLESIHQELQSEYMDLLQECSQLKNLLINHAGCQDPNIDMWIKNEASKYVRNLHNVGRVNSMYSVPSLDGDGSTTRPSSITSPLGGFSQGSPDRENEDLDGDAYSDDELDYDSDLGE
ncbi:transcription factor ATF2 [Metarhizium rileyi]|uniref:Transcription factor ATF2 n=1 Tax=Metarhizium rileyi (strain RCEF 4871) TaxID=1649241 RepID=A0A167KAC3_METRR|nr:transcription factor ATF2 [Metarhizium rileyi RCEF 4871]TWU74869.1 hypothetical protein ED733_002680 [Metarhizium rileyi]